MKKIILILFLNSVVFSSICFAEKYEFNKVCNPAILLEELKQVGINLEGKDQIGSLNTVEDKIVIVTKEDIDAVKLAEVIQNHSYTPPSELEKERLKREKEERKNNRESGKDKFKALGLSDDELNALFE